MADEFKVPILPSVPTKPEKPAAKEEEDLAADIHKPIPPKSTVTLPTPNPCPYKVPNWSAPPSDQNVNYKFEVLKSGQIIEEIDNLQKQATWKFGRLPENDMVLAHPTISRFHCILQYRPRLTDETASNEEANSPPEGWYIYDMGSTHGSFLNKQRIPPKVFIRIRVGHMLKLGASTRSYILQGPIEDEEPESDLSITELREQHERQKQEAAEAKLKAEEAEKIRKENEGISWGMSEDANEETDLTHNPYASSNNEDYFATNPKQALRHFFEREDMHLEYRCDEMSLGSFVCRIDLPVDDDNGRPITAEVVHKGKKKDCVFQCALEACRILDRLGVLRQKNQEPLARRKKPQSDSDDDEFLDRTGDIARKKERKACANTNVALTYDGLLKQEKDLMLELEKIEQHIAEYQAKQKRLKEQEELQNEDLDSFMEHLNEDDRQLDKTEIKKLRLEQQRLKSEQQRLTRLIKIAKPYDLPFPKQAAATDKDNSTSAATSAVKKQMPMIGKRNQFSKFKVIKVASKVSTTTSKAYGSDEEEIEEDDNQAIKTVETIEADKILNEHLEAVDIKTEKTRDKREPEKDLSTSITPTKEKTAAIESKTTVFEALPEEPSCSTVLEALPEEPLCSVARNEKSSLQVPIDDVSSLENSKKRARQRPKRSKRQDVDVEDLDEHEKEEKYAKWVPPANQSGDGFTSLNEKFGY